MKWDIDKALGTLELETPGTTAQRVIMSASLMKQHKLRVSKDDLERGSRIIWCLALGPLHLPKASFYGITIREAYLTARRFVKKASEQELLDMGIERPVYSKGYLEARKQRKKHGKGPKQSNANS
jgi:hypothetical protein